MAGEKIFKSWFDAPAGSTLVIVATGTARKKFVLATLDGVVTSNTGAVERKITGILNAATGAEERIPVKASKIYVVDVDLTFITDADAVVEAHVKLSGGGLFGKKFRTPISRKKGAAEAVTLLVSARA